MPNCSSLPETLERVNCFLNAACARFSTEGFDSACALYAEGLAFDGSRDRTLKQYRFRVQTRQLYVFAHRYIETGDAAFLTQIQACWNAVFKHVYPLDSGYAYCVDDTTAVSDAHSGAYEFAFALFAHGWMFQATQNPLYLEQAEADYQTLCRVLSAERPGLFRNAFPEQTVNPLQNPHMHLFEALLFLYVFSADSVWFTRAKALFDAVEAVFFDSENGFIREELDSDYRLVAASDRLQTGHFAEWVYLLGLSEMLLGVDGAPMRNALYAQMKRLTPSGALWGCCEVAPSGAVLNPLTRIWIPCETLKAHLTQFERNNDEAAFEAAHAQIKAMFASIVDAERGLWREYTDRAGNEHYGHVPATSLYHLYFAMTEFKRVADALLRPKCACCSKCGEHK